MKKLLISIFLSLFFTLSLGTSVVFAQDFFVSNSGSDNNSGTSIETPWKTVAKVNNYSLGPGDVVHFKCGDSWREFLRPIGGTDNLYITYTSYGTGAKPVFLGSINKSQKLDWVSEGNNIWTINSGSSSLVTLFNIPVENTYIWNNKNTSIRQTIENNGVNGKTIKLVSINSGNSSSSIQLILPGIRIEAGKKYQLTFKAKSSNNFKIPSIQLMKDESPWTSYALVNESSLPVISGEWTTYEVNFTSISSDINARLDVFLGKNQPDNNEFYISEIYFGEIENSLINNDIGNIIFDDGAKCGKKVFYEWDLKEQDDFMYNDQEKTVKIYSVQNPAFMYNSIELALNVNIININNSSYITIDGLDLKYGGACGVNAEDTDHIKILNCDISYIGGGVLEWKNGKPVRYGNGVNFWNNNHDNLVQGCNISQIYDTALTNQGSAEGHLEYNITYKDNRISNCEWSFEAWNNSESGSLYNIVFENNNCYNAGYGWGHSQRPDPMGRHLVLWANRAKYTKDIFIRNNVFSNAQDTNVFISPKWVGADRLNLDSNSYTQTQKGKIAIWKDIAYSANSFEEYQSDTKKDMKSKFTISDEVSLTVAMN